MERMLVVVFDSLLKTYEGTRALYQLDKEGSITIHALSVTKKNVNGKVELMKSKYARDFPIRTNRGTAIGSLIGLLGGPVGLLVGASTGTILGALRDLYVAEVNADFIDEVSSKLLPGKFAVVADISEERVVPLDIKMETLGGSVFRITKIDVKIDQMIRDVEVLKTEIEQLENEMTDANVEHKAKLQAEIDKQKEKLQNMRKQATERLEQINDEAEAKVQALEEKAAKAHGDIKAAIDAQLTEIREAHQQSVAKLKNLTAETLEKRAE